MQVILQFTTPYTRAQIRSGLSAIVIPSGSVVTVTAEAEAIEISSVSDSEDDLILTLTADGFTTVAEVGAFFASLPAGINARLRDASYL
jgi:hypothetical protein